MLSVGAIHFEDRFCTSKKGGIGGGRWVLAQGAMHMAAALAGCRKALVGTGLGISLFFDTNGRVKKEKCLFRSSMSGTVGSFQSGEAFTGQRALTIVSSLMSRCGRGHEPTLSSSF